MLITSVERGFSCIEYERVKEREKSRGSDLCLCFILLKIILFVLLDTLASRNIFVFSSVKDIINIAFEYVHGVEI